MRSPLKKRLYFVRGVPGSGKTHMAREIATREGGDAVVFSTDDYFEKKGIPFNHTLLNSAHQWNIKRATNAFNEGVSLVIVANTFVRAWEAMLYAKAALKKDYDVQTLEPNTEWCKNAQGCFDHNVHDVPLKTIEKMLNDWEEDYSIETIMTSALPPWANKDTVSTEPPVSVVSTSGDFDVKNANDILYDAAGKQDITQMVALGKELVDRGYIEEGKNDISGTAESIGHITALATSCTAPSEDAPEPIVDLVYRLALRISVLLEQEATKLKIKSKPAKVKIVDKVRAVRCSVVGAVYEKCVLEKTSASLHSDAVKQVLRLHGDKNTAAIFSETPTGKALQSPGCVDALEALGAELALLCVVKPDCGGK